MSHRSVEYEFYASLSGLEPEDIFTLQQHMGAVFGQRIGETVYDAARRVIGPTGSIQELNAFFTPFVGKMDFNDLLDVFTWTGQYIYTDRRVEVRRNLVLNPRMQSIAQWVFAPNTTTTATFTASSSGIRIDYIGDQESNNHIIYQSNTLPINGGDTVMASFEVEVPLGYPAVRLHVRTNAYATSAGATIGSAVTVQPGEVVTIKGAPLVAGALDNGVRSILQTNGIMAAGSRFFVRNSIVEKTDNVGPYFDGSTPIKLRRNLALNPSFEVSGGGTVQVVENYAVDPVPVLGAEGGWQAGDVITTMTDGTPCFQYTKIGTATPYIFSTKSPYAASAGSTYTMKAKIEIIGDDGATYTVQAHSRVGNVYFASGVQTITATGAPQEVTVVSTISADVVADSLDLALVRSGAGEIGIVLRMGHVLITPGVYNGLYFDGSYSEDPDFTTMWLGAANNAVSRATGTAPPSYATSSVVAYGIKSTRWVGSGTTSLRQIPTYSARGSAYTEFANHLNTLGMVPGRTYTIMAKFFQMSPQPFNVATARAILAATTNYRVQAANVEGVQDVRLLFTVPTSGSWYLRLYNGGMLGDPDVWWDDLAIVEGDYKGQYFDGSRGAPKGLASSWEGTPEGSASYIYDPTYTVSWTGTADNSQSIMTMYVD